MQEKPLFALTGLILACAMGVAQPASKAAGHWQGKIQIPEHELNFTVDLAKNAKGAWIGSMSITGTNSTDVPLNTIAIEEPAVRFSANLPDKASFDGQLSADGNSLSGKASSAAGEAPFVLTRSGEANVKTPPPSSALSKDFEGLWEGTLTSSGKTRRVGMKLAPAADGTATALLIAYDQGNQEIPATTVTIEDRQLVLEVKSVSGTYRGMLGASGEIAGEWLEGGNRTPLTFARAAKKQE
jgi:hypothetical protein